MIIAGGDGRCWAFATNGNGANVQTLRSVDLLTWEQGPDALPELPPWPATGDIWAPEVGRGDEGRFVPLLHDAVPRAIGEHPIFSAAVADSPGGPVRDSPPDAAGLRGRRRGIHRRTSVHRRRRQRYLYWKNDGNRIGADTWISVQRPDPSRHETCRQAERLMKQDLPWEGDLVEAPFLSERRSFWLFYSGNAFDSDEYAVVVATRRARRTVYEGSRPGAGFQRRGGRSRTLRSVRNRTAHSVWMAYHAWAPGSGRFRGSLVEPCG